ncbi:hypothetical protein B0H16DRAFT_1450996 [Mycena metata]|uniref:Uncharacterized protein n=1 Tax=Mycena metata TaxID=1033252 RepID=A0AAD7NSJ8_9AGAR|nr:hypothetical protein B0H16DRAFT_1450996 [Mycena metata]
MESSLGPILPFIHNSSPEYTGFRLSSEIIGPGRIPDSEGVVFVDKRRTGMDLEQILVPQCAVLRMSSEAVIFHSVVCQQYLPPSFKVTHAERILDYFLHGFIIPPSVDPYAPINTFLMPPTTRAEAIKSVSYQFTRWPQRPLCNVEADVLYCLAFRKPGGIYEVVDVVPCCRSRLIHPSTRVFSPSAWRGGGSVEDSLGEVVGGSQRLRLRLESEDIILVDVPADLVV